MTISKFEAKKGIKVGSFTVDETTGNVSIPNDLAVTGGITSSSYSGPMPWTNITNNPTVDLTINITSNVSGFSFSGTGTSSLIIDDGNSTTVDIQVTTATLDAANYFFTITADSGDDLTPSTPTDALNFTSQLGFLLISTDPITNSIVIENNGIVELFEGTGITLSGPAKHYTISGKDSSTIQKGIVQLSNATDSTSETLASTAKATKTVMDRALLSLDTSTSILQTIASSLKLRAGSTGTNTAPLYFQSGSLLSTPISGSVEYNGTDLYFTRSGVRSCVVLDNLTNITSPAIARTSLGLGTVATYAASYFSVSDHTHNTFASVVTFNQGLTLGSGYNLDVGNNSILNSKVLHQTPYTNTISGNTTTITLANGNMQVVPLSAATGTVTVYFSGTNAKAGYYSVVFVQGSTARTVSWSTGGVTWKWNKNSTGSITATANYASVLEMWFDGSTVYGRVV